MKKSDSSRGNHQSMAHLEVQFVESIEEFGPGHWNRLTGTENPFTRYEFLHSLEKTGCTTEQSGWAPHHVGVYKQSNGDRQSKTLIAVVPLYLKTNSWGEYVFDWSWANAYQSHGFNYYPKFVTAAPFTPSTGERIFVCKSYVAESKSHYSDVIGLVVEKIKEKAEFIGASSWHVLFPTKTEHELLTGLGIQSRVGTQFHWYNRGYDSFDDFLDVLNSRKRKSIRKERKQVADQGITFRRTEGADISEEQWADFYLFYQSTYLMRGQQGYLSQGFFHEIGKTMPEQILLISASQQGRDIAAALFFKNGQQLFGRYWGSAADFQFLHFETCYYQGQDYAIEQGIESFDSGAQGEHKIQRGFEPIFTHSNHWLAHSAFADAIKNFLVEEKPHIENYKKDAESLLPFKVLD